MAASKSESSYEVFGGGAGVPIESWTVGVPFEPQGRAELERIASLPFIYEWVGEPPRAASSRAPARRFESSPTCRGGRRVSCREPHAAA